MNNVTASLHDIHQCANALVWVEYGLTSHRTHYGSYLAGVFMGQRPTQLCQSTEGR